jgi:hypothetical protein
MMSTEAIVAIVALVVGLPPTLLALWHCIKRTIGSSGSLDSSNAGSGMCFNTALGTLVDGEM